MEGWIVAATVVTALAGLAAAGAAVWLAVLNRQLVKASQEQVKASQEQVWASQEQVSSQQRPVLVPERAPIFNVDDDNRLDWRRNEQPINIRNLGTGAAFNVASTLFGCASYVNPSLDLRDDSVRRVTGLATDLHWTLWLGKPIAPGAVASGAEDPHKRGHARFFIENDGIGGYSFNALDEDIQGVTTSAFVPWRIARVTITYHDITGRKYASIFDFVHHDTERNRGWHMVAILRDIERDLYDLEESSCAVPMGGLSAASSDGSAAAADPD